MTKLPPLSLLLLAPASAACSAEPPAPPAAPVALEIPRAEPPPAPPEPALELVAAAPAEEEEPVPFRCKWGQLVVADHQPYCIQSQHKSFQEAEQWCASNGGHLVRIGSEDENNQLQRALGSPVGFDGSAWFGLHASRGRRWTWSTGAPVSFTSWAPGEPNNRGGNEECGELYAYNALWNDLTCDEQLPYVCESRPARPGTRPPAMRCPASSARSFQAGGIDYCYLGAIHDTWSEADRGCKSIGGALASFRSQAEHDAFRNAIDSPVGDVRFWIGFTDEGHGGHWTTVTGHKMRYAHWRAGEPNNAGGNEHCAEWWVEDGGWNDIPCDQPHLGICAPR